MNPGAPGFFVWIYGGRECRCGQGFREGNGKLVRQRDVASIRGESRTPEGEVRIKNKKLLAFSEK